MKTNSLNRRAFLKGGAVLAAAAAASKVDAASSNKKDTKNERVELPPADGGRSAEAAKKLVLGVSCLQAPSDTSMGVAWKVNCLANGWVDVSERPDMKNARRVVCGGYGITGFDEDIIQVRIEGLKPATKYWYRIGAKHIDYVENYSRYGLDEVCGKVRSFTTLGAAGASHFCVMNDTHAKWSEFGPVTDKILALKPAVTVWNGDATNQTEDIATGVEVFLAPPIPHPDYCSEIPILWVNGNHDFRGRRNAHMERYVMTRLPTERSPRDWALTRNWAVRQGDIAMIGLDTGEDKPDRHPQFVGLVNCEPYRTAQTTWLRDQFKRPEIANAPYIVAFCHIPLFDRRPNANPGTILRGWADWQGQCAKEWGPILSEHGVQLVITAHIHEYRCDPASGTRKWDQIVGGGVSGGGKQSTVIEGKVEKDKLVVRVHNTGLGKVQGVHTYAPRKV